MTEPHERDGEGAGLSMLEAAPRDGRSLWDQQHGEPDRDYARFLGWLSAPKRNLRIYAEANGVSWAWVKTLSSRWGWQERAVAYDLQQAKQVNSDIERHRSAAALSMILLLREALDSRLDGGDKHDSQDLQRLSSALKSQMPNMEVSVTAREDESGEDEVLIAVRRAKELMAEDEAAQDRGQ